MANEMYDFVIVGGGPAGTAAAVYAARKRLKTLLVTDTFGGQSIVSADIQNWIGEPHISGFDLATKFEAHVRAHADIVEVKDSEKVKVVRKAAQGFELETEQGNVYRARAVMLAAGARRRKLGVPGEEKLDGKGVAYCSTCDAPIFKGKAVAVVGGGNAGLEAVTDLLPYASKVFLLEYGDSLKGDPVTQSHITGDPKVTVVLNAQTKEVVGEGAVTGLAYVDRTTNKVMTLDVQGVFVEIGSVPNSDMVKGLVELDRFGQVVIDSKHGTTSVPGIFAAGDITDDPYKQNNISAGDAVKATLAAYAYLLAEDKQSRKA